MHKSINLLNNALNISRILIDAVVSEGNCVIDATLGNGHDAAYLAERVGESGTVYAFDVQPEAFQAARATLGTVLSPRVTMIEDSHERMCDHVKEPVKLILFNLGYLPGAGRGIVTKAESTVRAVRDGLSLLGPHGVVMLVVYRGHAEGQREWQALCTFAQTPEQHRYNVLVMDFPNQQNDPPALIAFQKRN